MSHDAVEFVLKAVEMVAEHGWKLLPQVHKKEKLCDNRKICEDINNHRSCMFNQEPITRSMQLPHIPVTAFSQTDLFSV